MLTTNSHYYQTVQQKRETPFNRTLDSRNLAHAVLNTSLQGKHGPNEQHKHGI